MLAKKTSKNQVTLPKAIADRFPQVDYFEVNTDGSAIFLRPLEPSRASVVRERLAKLGLTEKDVSDAVDWARSKA